MNPRIIPSLLLNGNGLVKTLKFKNPTYIGDPINAVRIFNDKEVDELAFLDITATIDGREPNFRLIHDIASEAFMPFSYGGGISSIFQMEKLFHLGIEKVILNSAAFKNPDLVKKASELFGAQSIVVSIDYRSSLIGKRYVCTNGGKTKTNLNPESYAEKNQDLGAGEILLNCINKDGTQSGYDIETIRRISQKLEIPLIASGGAATLNDFKDAVINGGASAVAAGSMFVYHGIHKAVLISYPSYEEVEKLFNDL